LSGKRERLLETLNLIAGASTDDRELYPAVVDTAVLQPPTAARRLSLRCGQGVGCGGVKPIPTDQEAAGLQRTALAIAEPAGVFRELSWADNSDGNHDHWQA
jgi:hypothetical protein